MMKIGEGVIMVTTSRKVTGKVRQVEIQMVLEEGWD